MIVRPHRLLAGAAWVAVAAGTLGSCQRDAFLGSDARQAIEGGARDGAASADGWVDAPPEPTDTSRSPDAHACVPATCQGHLYDCGDCLDNDADGKADMDDPDCFGPCHNSEETFFGSIPGQNHAGCVEDCYFDQDSGSGNDGCTWSHACDPLAVAPDFPPAGAECAYDAKTRLPRGDDCTSALTQQPAQCNAVCGPLTPNGCDCFGCCSIPGAATPVWLASADELGNPTCDLAHVGDPTRCKPCTQVTACLNPCETCELCIGKRTLPASCNPGADCPTPKCERGAPCGLDCLPECPDGQVCITGCCAPILR